MGIVVRLHGDGVLNLLKDSRVGGVACDGDGAGSIGIAVAPAYKAVAGVRCSSQGNLFTIEICAAARSGTILAIGGDGVGIGAVLHGKRLTHRI